MSITAVCRDCRETFRKFSMKSRETICPDCKGKKGKNRYRVMSNKTQDAITTIANMDKEIENLKTSIDVLHSTIGVEVQHQITNDIKPIVEKIVDEKVNELKGVIISSMTKSQKAQEEIKELTKTINLQKGSITRIRNKIKAFEKRLGI